MANRVLLGRGTSNRGTSNYGLWVSDVNSDVIDDGNDDLLFNGGLPNANPTGSAVTNKFGETFGVKYKGEVSVSNGASGTPLKIWPESDFTFGGTIYAPLCFVQVDSSPGASNSQIANTMTQKSSNSSTAYNWGCMLTVYPKNRNSSGGYDANGTYGMLSIVLPSFGSQATIKAYYAVCYPYTN